LQASPKEPILDMDVVTTTQALADLCARARTRPFCAIDTEFMRETTYWAKLCLVQIAFEGGEAVIDPLAPGIDLEPLFALMADRAVLKVFHAARQDIEIFHNLTGQLPAPVFDTQIAAMAAGLGDSISYDALVQALLRRRIDKSSRFTDWSRRPLGAQQLEYALGDVTHLRDAYALLQQQLASQGRAHWLDEEMQSLLDPQNYDTAPENAWRRLKLRRHTPDYLAALATAAAWRERSAQERNVPRGRILKDDGLYEIADQKPRSAEAMDRMRAVPKGFGRSQGGQDLLRELSAALADPKAYAPSVERAPPGPAVNGSTLEMLRVLLRVVAEEHGVAPRLIANAADLEDMAASNEADVAGFRGWRDEIFGRQVRALKAGDIALRMERGRITVMPVPAEAAR